MSQFCSQKILQVYEMLASAMQRFAASERWKTLMVIERIDFDWVLLTNLTLLLAWELSLLKQRQNCVNFMVLDDGAIYCGFD